MKLYERKAPEGPDTDEIPADLVHHFLLAISATPGVGICFRDRGWYPRETDDVAKEGSGRKADAGKVYNRILGNILNGLKVNEDSRQQELALRIMKACPELVAGYVLRLSQLVHEILNHEIGTGAHRLSHWSRDYLRNGLPTSHSWDQLYLNRCQLRPSSYPTPRIYTSLPRRP